MSEKISIIVPVYNVEKYLKRCIQSLQAQTYQNKEIILVDDGSIDQSGIICDYYAKKDEQIKVIHKQNGGLSDARNMGINVASGTYIVFVDSDDWIESDILEKAYQTLKENESDMIIWGYFADFVTETEQLEKSVKYTLKGICDKELRQEVFTKENGIGLTGYVWNKLYKATIVKHCQFVKDISLVEDIVFNSEVIKKCKKIVFLDYAGTHYIQRDKSTLGSKYYPNYIELKFMAWNAINVILKEFYVPEKEKQKIMRMFYVTSIKSVFRLAVTMGNERQEKTIRVKELVKDSSIRKIVNEINPEKITDKIIFLFVRMKAWRLLLQIWS